MISRHFTPLDLPLTSPPHLLSFGLLAVGKGGVHRFTVRTAGRDLKLRGAKSDFDSWIAALRPFVKSFEEDLEEDSVRAR